MNLTKENCIQQIEDRLRGKDLEETITDYYQSTGREADFKNRGIYGQFTEEYCFDQKPNSIAGRDLPWAEVKTKKTKVTKDGILSFSNNTPITSICRESFNQKSFDHSTLLDKVESVLWMFYEKQFICAKITESDDSMISELEKMYGSLSTISKKRSITDEEFYYNELIAYQQSDIFYVHRKRSGDKVIGLSIEFKARYCREVANEA
jgi:hypothetical protein